VDWNNDGRKDLITGDYDGCIRIYYNQGTDAAPVFDDFSYLVMAGARFSCGYYSDPEIVDWNNDGLLDIVCGESEGRILLLLNEGTKARPVFNSKSYLMDNGRELRLSGSTSPTVGDWNLDGKKDLIVGDASGRLLYFENRGSDAQPVFNGWDALTAAGTTIQLGSYTRPEMVDWDNDGRLDLICGASGRRYSEVNNQANVWYFHAPNGPYLLSFSTPGASLAPGTLARLVCLLGNPQAPMANVRAELISDSPEVMVQAGIWEVGSLTSGQVKSNVPSAFEVRLASNALLGATLPLRLRITSTSANYHHDNQLRLEVVRPQFVLDGFLINDSSGDRDCAIDPNERSQVIVRLRNNGFPAEAVRGWAYGYSDLTVTTTETRFGSIAQNATGLNSLMPLGIKAGASATNPLQSLVLYVTCAQAGFTNYFNLNLLPDYPWTTNTDFSWIDTRNGTSVMLGDNDYEYIDLPFSPRGFPFFDYQIAGVTLTSDGCLAFYNYGDWPDNTAVPNAAWPDFLIAPFWDDLDPSAGGSIRYLSGGSSPNRYWVVEWNQVPRRRDLATRMTFQVMLYESGNIKFQYGTSSGPQADGRSATIGLEYRNGSKGSQYAYNQVGAVRDGLAILFQNRAGSMDTDNDLLPDAFEQFYFGSLQSSASDDPDRDGLSNLDEFLRCSNPNGINPQLRLQNHWMVGANQIQLQWPSMPDRVYTLWQCSDLKQPTWTQLNPKPIVGSADGWNTYYIQSLPASGHRFWRISSP
jgi:hypothetical protein